MENNYKINKTLFENIRNKGFASFTDVQKNVIKKNWEYGAKLIEEGNKIAKKIKTLVKKLYVEITKK